MNAPECDIKLHLAGDGARSSLTLSLTPPKSAGNLVARLVQQVEPDKAVACVAFNPFESLDRVAARIGNEGIVRHAEGFVVARASGGALASLLSGLDAEALVMTYGGEREVQRLASALDPPWWKLAPSDPELVGREPVLRFAASHGALDVSASRALVLKFFDHARALCAM